MIVPGLLAVVSVTPFLVRDTMKLNEPFVPEWLPTVPEAAGLKPLPSVMSDADTEMLTPERAFICCASHAVTADEVFAVACATVQFDTLSIAAFAAATASASNVACVFRNVAVTVTP